MLNHASWRLFRAKLKLRFLSRRTQLNRTELGSPPPWAPLRHCHCHSAQLSSNEMKWMATNSARKWHAFISGHETRPSPIRFAQESLVSGEISLPNVWGPGTFMFYFIVLMRIFARDQRKYLLSTILKYERFSRGPRFAPGQVTQMSKYPFIYWSIEEFSDGFGVGSFKTSQQIRCSGLKQLYQSFETVSITPRL